MTLIVTIVYQEGIGETKRSDSQRDVVNAAVAVSLGGRGVLAEAEQSAA